MRIAAGWTRRTGRRDLIGARLRPNSGVSTDRFCVIPMKGDTVMITLGADLHKRTHTIVATDANGVEQAALTVAATPEGHRKALGWAQQFAERGWALENCRHLSRRFEEHLVRSGEKVVQVSPKLMAGARRGSRERGKSDPIDALAVARAALREPHLPVARLEGIERDIKLLVDHREDLVAERSRNQQRLRWHLLDLGIQETSAGALDRYCVLDDLAEKVRRRHGTVAEIAAELIEDCRRSTERVTNIERRIKELVVPLVPTLLALRGCGVLSAAKIIGETAGIDRFRSKSAFAMHNGTAPIPVWSGNHERHRLNRGGNRQLNVALHRIAITQMQRPGPAQDYIAKRKAAGDTKTEAIRALRRRISDEVFRRLAHDKQNERRRDACFEQAA